MSDYDRGKFYGGRKKPNPRDTSSNFGSRFFNSKNSHKSGSRESLNVEGKPKIKQPTILLKAREHQEERSVSPKQLGKDEAPSATPISIATSNAAAESHLPSAPKEMTNSVKLLEDGAILVENLQDFVQENNDFLVVGIVGAQGVGKSTLLNLLASNKVTDDLKRAVFTDVKPPTPVEDIDAIHIFNDTIMNLKISDDGMQEIDNSIFKVKNNADFEVDNSTTYGVDCFITQNRMILLDCQPFNSIAVLDELIQSENKRSNLMSEFLPLENSGEIYGLQLTAFLMSVCHVLIVVQDWFCDSNVIRFMQTAEMLKPTISSIDDEIVEHFPHLMLVHNRAQMEDFTPNKFKIIQKIYKSAFSKSKFHLETGMGIGSGRIVNVLSPENCGDPMNIFLIPDYNEEVCAYKGHPPLEELIRKMRAMVLGAAKYPLTHVQLNEKNWLTFCSKVWDHVKKSSFFVEYTKLMP